VPVELSCDLKDVSRYTRILREEAAALIRLLGREDCELSILLTSDRRMKQLNRYYRYLDRATDVLSFAQIEDGQTDAFAAAPGEYRPPDAKPLGDVVISLETALRQAREMRETVGRRLRTLLVHGVLHLLGYDHVRSKAAARLMFDYQERLEAMLEEALKPNQTAGGQPG
jgi:probable rRNA maturation factor